MSLFSSSTHTKFLRAINFGLAALMLVLAVSVPAQNRTAPPDIEKIVAEFNRNAAIMNRVRGTTESRTVDAQGVEKFRSTAKWAADGDKCFRETLRSDFGETNTEIFDGKMGYDIIPRGDGKTPAEKVPNLYTTTRRAMVTTFEFRYGFVLNGKRFSDLIKQPEYRFVRQEEDPIHGTVYKFSNQGADPKKWETFSLAPKYGCLSVKTETHWEGRGEVQVSTWTVQKFQKIGDSFFPEIAEQRSTTTEGANERVQVTTETIRDLSTDVPASLFAIRAKPGDAFKESETNLYWRIGQNGERKYIDISGGRRTNALPKWLYTPSILILLILTVLAYVRWKRKQMKQSV